jgi:hypothetical protein
MNRNHIDELLEELAASLRLALKRTGNPETVKQFLNDPVSIASQTDGMVRATGAYIFTLHQAIRIMKSKDTVCKMNSSNLRLDEIDNPFWCFPDLDPFGLN